MAARTVASLDDATTLEVAAASDADYLLGVFLEKGTYRLLGIVRVRWSMVEWLGKPHGTRLRLRWTTGGALKGIAELL